MKMYGHIRRVYTVWFNPTHAMLCCPVSCPSGSCAKGAQYKRPRQSSSWIVLQVCRLNLMLAYAHTCRCAHIHTAHTHKNTHAQSRTQARIHTHTHKHTHAHTRTHTRIQIHTHKHTHAHTRTHAHTNTHAHTYTQAHTNTQAHTHTHAHPRAHIRTHNHTCTHAQTHTHTHTLVACSPQQLGGAVPWS